LERWPNLLFLPGSRDFLPPHEGLLPTADTPADTPADGRRGSGSGGGASGGAAGAERGGQPMAAAASKSRGWRLLPRMSSSSSSSAGRGGGGVGGGGGGGGGGGETAQPAGKAAVAGPRDALQVRDSLTTL
jgi:hypothetical protein